MHLSQRLVIGLLLFVLGISVIFYFYNLGSSSLVSWDEAWYAAISRNIHLTHNPFLLTFNGARYADHPPAGFWFIALSQAFFGYSEFAARAPSAVAGILALIFVYLLGARLTHPWVGLSAAFALSSSPWFVYRARSGNLDILLTLFITSTFYFAFSLKNSPRYKWPFIISLSLALLTKTLVPLALIPALFFLLPSPAYLLIFAAIALALPWFLLQLLTYPAYLHRFFGIGLPQVSLGRSYSSYWVNFRQALSYLHYSLERWFRPILLFTAVSALISFRRVLPLLVFLALFILPSLMSPKVQIWHLIPLHPLLLFLLCHGLYRLVHIFSPRFAAPVLLTLIIFIGVPQIWRNWYTFISIPAYISDEAILSRHAAAYPQPLIIDDDFLPAAVYYSGKNVTWLNTPNFAELASRPHTLIITKLSRAKAYPDQSRFQYLAFDRDKVLLLTP